MSLCPRCKVKEKYLTWSYCKECSRIKRAESKANHKPEGRQYEHNEARPDGPAKVFYDAMVKTLQEKYDVKDAELRKNGYDPAIISAGLADEL